MLPQHVLLALAAAVSAVPLNINLGAYSPALVVGDGEISLGAGGAESASKLMATLATGAAEGQAAQAQGAQPTAEPQKSEAAPAEAKPEEAKPEEKKTEEGTAKRTAVPNLKREAAESHVAAIESAVEWIKRDLQGFNAALSYAREAMKDSPKIELGSPGAGVGIVVNAGVNVPKDSAAAGTPPPAERVKRSDVVTEASESPKMTLVAITEV
jgi:hypothetical protein